MSASLVGSEMCIRDRVVPPGISNRASVGCPRAPSSAAGWNAVRAGDAVSYTHLTLPTICSV
eukprot:213828-Alexandrium_andersonii.AAC.1